MLRQTNEIKVEVTEWLDQMFASHRYGSFGIEIKMHDGTPVAVEKMERVVFSGRDETRK